MIDSDGYRFNVGIIITNKDKNKIFFAKRCFKDSWQFPQGGINELESPLNAMYRELKEEVGLSKHDVKVLSQTKNWVKYDLPNRYIQSNKPHCIGQKQIWFLLQLTSSEENINLSYDKKIPPEFESWKWVNYWHPINYVIYFKLDVYRKVLIEFKDYFLCGK